MARILAVDDDSCLIELLRSHLEGMGHAVFSARDVPEGVTAAQEHRPDLVILDFEMPTGSGADAAARLGGSSGTAGIPVIFLTGMNLDAVKGIVGLGGNRRFLSKPIDFDALDAAIKEVVG